MRKKALSKRMLLIISFIAAIALWFIVSVILNPIGTRGISNIPISLSNGTATLDSLGMSVVNSSVNSVSVEVSGSRLAITGLTADDFTVTPVYSGISGAGVYTLNLAVMLKDANAGIEIISFSPHTINLTVARIDTQTFPLVYKVNGDVPEGYYLESVSLSEKSVTVSGPSDVVSRIASAQVDIDELTNGISTLPVRLLDEASLEVSDENLTYDITSATVNTVLLKTKTIDLTAALTDVPSGVYSSAVTLSVEPSQVTIAGHDDIIDSIADEFTVASISLSEVTSDDVREFELSLPGEIKTIDGTTAVDVTVDVADNIIVSYIDIRDFTLSDYLQGYNVTVSTTRLRNVQLVGPADVLDEITAGDIVATVVYDETQTPQKGLYAMEVVISSPTVEGFWVAGRYEVNVKVE